jgi:hypothetical protein
MSDSDRHTEFYVQKHAEAQRTIRRLVAEVERLKAENAALRGDR